MIKRELLDTAQIPNGGGEMRLYERELKGANEYSIMLGRIELMNSRLFGSEEALASLSFDAIKGKKSPNILIGGLGMGFTLRAALALAPQDAKITVSELVPAVEKWARGPMGALHGGSLDDPRVTIKIGDVAKLLAATNEYDIILLDVDNGPDGLTHDTNEGLYSHTGLHTAKAALTKGGVLAVWSSGPDNGFTRRLRDTGFHVSVEKVRARGTKGAHHVIWLAIK